MSRSATMLQQKRGTLLMLGEIFGRF